MVLTVSFALFLVIGLLVTITGRMRKHSCRLDASVEATVARIPKFVRYSRPHFHELRNAQGNSNFLNPVPLTTLKFQ